MTTATQQAAGRRWVLPFLAAVVAVLATLSSSASASAATTTTAETRVGASSVVVEPLVGPPEHIDAGQRLGNEPVRVVVVVATGVAANGGLKALPSGPKLTAQWGADTYRHGGLMSTIEHINYRHAFNSGFKDVSRFAQGTSARDIKALVDQALRTGAVTDRGVIANIGRPIGTGIDGKAVTGLEVIVRDGIIKTAYPVGIP